jgi:(1->4)-alpha-D-glucan 1-alpha-D-glucosylmutase
MEMCVSYALSSTYRVQLHAGFNFEAASEIADYISKLGVSHLYASPYLQTAPGSTHGYDVADFRSVNRELGGASAHQQFCRRLSECGLGQILDIVPNHIALAQENPYWWDVLENGPESRYAEYFDLDWETGEPRLRNKVLLPVLADQYGVMLSKGSIQIERKGTRFEVNSSGNKLPIASSSMEAFLNPAAHALNSDTLGYISDALGSLTLQDRTDRPALLKRQRDRAVLLAALDRLLAEDGAAVKQIDEAIASINTDVDALDAFLQKQVYRLAYWRVSDQDLGYRRFFDINSLIGLRVERSNVFLDTHALILEWLRSGLLSGVRIDHIDGLRDPARYLERLREEALSAYIAVEKILGRDETLPDNWPVAGTTGYEFIRIVNGLLISPEGLNAIDRIYEAFIGQQVDYSMLAHDKKLAVTLEALGSDVNRLTAIFVEICEGDRDHRDYTRGEMRNAIREIAACFPIYRTYVSPERGDVREFDAAVIQAAITAARQRRADIDPGLFDFMSDVLLLRRRGQNEAEFVLRFQQFTSPVMAKGVEDTALYCYNRLIGVNEVGSDPGYPVVTIDEFHRFNAYNQEHHPLGMLTTSTHDTKRGEDVRARLAVLTETPAEFASAIDRWSALNNKYRQDNLPDPNTEYFYYQTLIGAWPISADRASAYMQKAAREAKQNTSWTRQDQNFEAILNDFVRETLSSREFCADVDIFIQLIENAARSNSLAQTLLKYTSPGVPDLYQGSELWDHRLVDPDNRTPVDFELRRAMLENMQTINVDSVLDRMDEGMPKLWTIHHALRVRKMHPECFGALGTYTPLIGDGARSQHVVAFQRGDCVVAVAPRLSLEMAGGWQETTIVLPEGQWRNELTGDSVRGCLARVQTLLSRFPVALLTRER